MNTNINIPKIFLFWWVKVFQEKSKISEKLQIKETSVHSLLYRNTGYATEQTKAILDVIGDIGFDEKTIYTLMSKEEFLEIIKNKL